MAAALNEISELEEEYLSMFVGYSESNIQKMNYEVIPEKDKDVYIAFRVSQSDGLVPVNNMSGKPYMLKLDVGQINPIGGKSGGRGKSAYYRIPAICDVQLTDGVNVLLQTRIPVYQLGIESSFPLKR